MWYTKNVDAVLLFIMICITVGGLALGFIGSVVMFFLVLFRLVEV